MVQNGLLEQISVVFSGRLELIKPDIRMPIILFNFDFDWQVTGCLEIMIDLDNFPALSERIEHVWTPKYGNHDLIRQGKALNMNYCYQVDMKSHYGDYNTFYRI